MSSAASAFVASVALSKSVASPLLDILGDSSHHTEFFGEALQFEQEVNWALVVMSINSIPNDALRLAYSSTAY